MALSQIQAATRRPIPGNIGVVWQWRTLRTWILRRIALGKGAETGSAIYSFYLADGIRS